MDWLRTLLSRCAAFFDRKKLDEDLDEELLSHIELAVEENLRRVMTEDAARRAALLKFGGIAQVKKVYRL
jgi:macrolide transport system ATP-binding/permease protein